MYGYVKYRDIFGDSHITGYAAITTTPKLRNGSEMLPGQNGVYWT